MPSQWSAVGDDAYEVTTFVECPAERPAVKAVQGSGTKLEAVRRAVIKAFASYVYGLDAYDQYINEIPIPDLDFFPGKLIIKRVDAMNLVYAITEVRVRLGMRSFSGWSGWRLSQQLVQAALIVSPLGRALNTPSPRAGLAWPLLPVCLCSAWHSLPCIHVAPCSLSSAGRCVPRRHAPGRRHHPPG